MFDYTLRAPDAVVPSSWVLAVTVTAKWFYFRRHPRVRTATAVLRVLPLRFSRRNALDHVDAQCYRRVYRAPSHLRLSPTPRCLQSNANPVRRGGPCDTIYGDFTRRENVRETWRMLLWDNDVQSNRKKYSLKRSSGVWYEVTVTTMRREDVRRRTGIRVKKKDWLQLCARVLRTVVTVLLIIAFFRENQNVRINKSIKNTWVSTCVLRGI